MWAGTAIFTIGAGLLYTLGVYSDAGKWIGYQILAGIGAGGSVQIPFVAVQVVLTPKEMPTGSEFSLFLLPSILFSSPFFRTRNRIIQQFQKANPTLPQTPYPSSSTLSAARSRSR